MRHLHPLWIPRCPGGVDQGDHVVGLHRTPGRVEIEVVLGGGVEIIQRQGAIRSAVDTDDLLELGPACPDPVHVLLFADHHFGAGVTEHVGQLLSGQGVVHRKRGGAEMLRTDFQWIELDPVRHHQRHRVTVADADAVQAGGDPSNVGGVLAPCQCLGVAGGAKRDRVRVHGRCALKRLAHSGWPAQLDFRITHSAEASPAVRWPVWELRSPT